MSGEVNLQILLKEMKPSLNEGKYVYCTVESKDQAARLAHYVCSQKKRA